MKTKRVLTASFLPLALLLGTTALWAQTGAAITKSVPIGAPDRWDYVVLDPSGTHASLAHGDRITVVETVAGKVSGTLAVGGSTHGVVVLPGEAKGYAGDGQAGTVAVFDPRTMKILKTIKAEKDADGIVYDPKTGHVLVTTGDSAKVVVIDPKTDTVLAEIDGGGPLEFGAADGRGFFFVDGEDKIGRAHGPDDQPRHGALAADRLQDAARHGHGPRPSPPVRQLRQWRDGCGQCR